MLVDLYLKTLKFVLKLPLAQILKFAFTSNAKPKCKSVEYRLRWVPNVNFSRWPCTFHYFFCRFHLRWVQFFSGIWNMDLIQYSWTHYMFSNTGRESARGHLDQAGAVPPAVPGGPGAGPGQLLQRPPLAPPGGGGGGRPALSAGAARGRPRAALCRPRDHGLCRLLHHAAAR